MASRSSDGRRYYFGLISRHETSLLRSGITHNRPGIRTNFRDGFARDSLLQRRVLCEPLFNARQTGLDKQQAVQEKLALLAC